uniref:Uncharacterized protein n=1 Tax=Globodera rostochiensis TaxID=31243 RepID=A0A914HG08_GLORO
MESDLDKMREQHTKEIVEGRRWLENQRELITAERKAFQEEQSLILDWIEHKKTEMEADKHERREFARQRDADVLRLREEAEQLEQSLAQVESARHALLNARRDLEHKGEQLNELKDALIRSEQRFHWRNRAFAEK